MRLPNIITAIADILAGIAIAGSLIGMTFGATEPIPLGRLMIEQFNVTTLKLIGLLVLSTIGLYGGGVVLNDVFDAELDKKERPERPIPTGLISKRSAAVFGIILLLIGIAAAALTEPTNIISAPAIIATVIAFAAVIYDKWMKHNAFFGPLNMGICRGLNLLLGISITSYALHEFWHLAIVPVVYIAAITMISRGEVHGGKRATLYFAGFLYAAVILTILKISQLQGTLTKSLPFILMFGLMITLPLQTAINKPEGSNIGKAVKAGILGLILMNAAWAAAFGDLIFAGVIFLLLPVSYLLSRIFAVT
ncbi:MAG: UbiA-like protein EboC [Chitinophagaceae bacterium]|nr:UbiA-like protein EboC [Chitinophagaceae bacterium]